MKKILVTLLIMVCVSFSFADAQRIPPRYRDMVRRAVHTYFGRGVVDYHWIEAQMWQESRFNSKATSPVGAQGLMQIMPGTAKDISRRLKIINDPYQPRIGINMGVWYDSMLFKKWSAPRPHVDRICFMLGSYNAGMGNILKAQKEARRRGLSYNLWCSIEKTLHFVTGHHSRETIDYVIKIKAYKNNH